jgi:hypothetical protein
MVGLQSSEPGRTPSGQAELAGQSFGTVGAASANGLRDGIWRNRQLEENTCDHESALRVAFNRVIGKNQHKKRGQGLVTT